MKLEISLSLFAVWWLFLSSITPTLALKCGIAGVTEQCMGDTDPRYDPDVSYDLKEQSGYYANAEGLYVSLNYKYLADGLPSTTHPLGTEPGAEALGNFSFFPSILFSNITINGPRMQIQGYEIFTSTEGKPGIISRRDRYYVSTFEKNGQSVRFGNAGISDTIDNNIVDNNREYLDASSDTTAGMFTDNKARKLTVQASYLTDGIRSSHTMTIYRQEPEVGQPFLYYLERGDGTRIKDASAWVADMEKAMDEAYVWSTEFAPPIIPLDYMRPTKPVTTLQCTNPDQDLCATEEDWRKEDPNFNDTPYVEPNGVLTGGFIAAVTISSIVVAVAIFYFVNRSLMRRQEQRLKSAFSAAVSRHIDGGLTSNLSPEEVSKLYHDVDIDGNGNISKSELKQLINEDGVGNLSDKDFDMMFSTIDLDGNGNVTFTEFIAFFASLPTDNGDETWDENATA